MIALTDIIKEHVTPRVVILYAETRDRYLMTIGWHGVYYDEDVTELYWKAIKGEDGASHALRDMAKDFVVKLAHAIVKACPVSELERPAEPDTAAVLEAEIEASEDDGELH